MTARNGLWCCWENWMKVVVRGEANTFILQQKFLWTLLCEALYAINIAYTSHTLEIHLLVSKPNTMPPCFMGYTFDSFYFRNATKHCIPHCICICFISIIIQCNLVLFCVLFHHIFQLFCFCVHFVLFSVCNK